MSVTQQDQQISGLTRYAPLFRDASSHLVSLCPTCIIALARKGPRLLQLMEILQNELPDTKIVTNHALDFMSEDELGDSPVIFDDVTVVGTTLHHLQQRVYNKLGITPHVLSVVEDSKNFKRELVQKFHSVACFGTAETQQFSSEIIRAIPFLGVPYDLDHPIYSFKRDQIYPIIKKISEQSTAIHQEHLTPQYEGDYTVTTIHLKRPDSVILDNIESLLGKHEISKLKVVDSRIQECVRIVPMVCFPPVAKSSLVKAWKALDLPSEFSSPLAMYRVLCFVGACAYGEGVDSEICRDTLMREQAKLVLGESGLDAVEVVLDRLNSRSSTKKVLLSLDGVEHGSIDSSEFAEPFSLLSLVENTDTQDIASIFNRLCDYWETAFVEVELAFRRSLDAGLQAGHNIDSILQETAAKRLHTGVPVQHLFDLVNAQSVLERSIALDLAVDSGVQVPMYAETDNLVARVYHHGESAWDGRRFGALIWKVLNQRSDRDAGIPVIALEKCLVILHDLATSAHAPMFSRILHYLSIPRAEAVSPDSILCDIQSRQHGRSLEVRRRLEGLDSEGQLRWSNSKPAVYWLRDHVGVLDNLGRGHGVIPRKLNDRSQMYDEAIPSSEVCTPVAMLFDFLLDKIPKKLAITEETEFDRDSILRLLSSCATRPLYLRSIAEDAFLIAQRRHAYGRLSGDDAFWLKMQCRLPAGEIYQKWQAYFLREPCKRALEAYYRANALVHEYELFIAPLFVADIAELRGAPKIENRCLTLMMCIESVTMNEKKAESSTSVTRKIKAFDWLSRHGYMLPDSMDDKLQLADRICDEICVMFPTLIYHMGIDQAAEDQPEVFIYSDMRDSLSDSKEALISESAKSVLIEDLRKLADEYSAIHFNDDMNDEFDLFVPEYSAADIILRSILNAYASHDKYCRVGVTSSADTLQYAVKTPQKLPSAPVNYGLAKRLAEYVRSNPQLQVNGIPLSRVEERHANPRQRHGIIAIGKATATKLNVDTIMGSRREFDSLDEFLSKSDDGWLQIIDDEMAMGGPGSLSLDFLVYLYR